jgi:hypothetical protein
MKKLIINSLLIFVFVSTICFGGCAGMSGENPLTSIENNRTTQILLKTSVQYGCTKYLSKNPEHIEKAERLVSDLGAALTNDIQVTLNNLEMIVIKNISWEKMEPEDRVLLTTLLTEIKYQVGQRIGEGVLDENDKVFAQTFLSWIEQAIIISRV